MPSSDTLRLYRETLQAQLHCLQGGCFKFHLPRPLGKMARIAGTHFHFDPELFIQIGGLTDFTFPEEKTRLMAGENLLVPRRLPHSEIARDYKGNFLNMVVMFPREGVSIHAAARNKQGHPQSYGLEYFRTTQGLRIEQYLDDIADFYHSGGDEKKDPEVEKAVRGLFQAAFAALLLIVNRNGAPARTGEHPKIEACRKLIISRIYDSSLSVQKLAGQIHCSPDYLSHLFATETGERLVDFIHQERIALAKRHLRNPALSIKEIAWACGFADQGYFTRLFRRLAGETPKVFRKKCGESP
ncbi:MAG: helix-turn-helix transcriptional regulator [Kiritimatiellae bacterium]|nr:helix-turn-helix transcriptional regulator [Kiritimatiellia bacterium]